MAWLESHQTLGAHPKTRKLAHVLNISKPQAIGHLHCFWWWAMDYAGDGSLRRYDALDIAIGAEWEGDAGEFVDALIAVGFIDDTQNHGCVIHDWHDYAGKLIERRDCKRSRDRAARHRHRNRIIDRDGYTCGICGGDVPPGDIDIDHIIPVSRGGLSTPENLRVTHRRCNRSRGNRT